MKSGKPASSSTAEDEQCQMDDDTTLHYDNIERDVLLPPDQDGWLVHTEEDGLRAPTQQDNSSTSYSQTTVRSSE